MVLNAQQKVKEKVLEKVIAQEQFSDGFKSLRDFFNKSKETDEIAAFVEEVLIANYADLKKTRSKNGTKNIPFIERGKKLIGYDFTDFMIQTLIESNSDDKFIVGYRLDKELLSKVRTSRTEARLNNSSIHFDETKKTFQIKSFKDSGGIPKIDESDYQNPFSKDTNYVSNIRKLFLLFLKENNNNFPLDTYNSNIYISFELMDLFVNGQESVYVGFNRKAPREDFLSEAVDHNFKIFLFQFYKNLEKFHKNNVDEIKVYLALNQQKLTLDRGVDDDYILISSINKAEVGYRNLLAGYIWKNESIDKLKNFFVNRISSDFENYLSKILESNYNLEHVFKKEVPLSILSDYQIIESIKIRYAGTNKIDLDILKIIKDNCHDPKQFSRLMNLIEENL